MKENFKWNMRESRENKSEGVMPFTQGGQSKKQGFTIVFVLVVITLFSASAMTIMTRYGAQLEAANRNAENTAVYYWQEGRLRLVRYKFGIEMLNHKGEEWTEAEQKDTLRAIINEVFPSDRPFHYRKTPFEPNGGYESQSTYTGTLLPY